MAKTKEVKVEFERLIHDVNLQMLFEYVFTVLTMLNKCTGDRMKLDENHVVGFQLEFSTRNKPEFLVDRDS